jgi:hypothetical protein
MDAVISALEHSLSRARHPALRQQLTDTIDRLRKRRRLESGHVPPLGQTKRRSGPNGRRKLQAGA